MHLLVNTSTNSKKNLCKRYVVNLKLSDVALSRTKPVVGPFSYIRLLQIAIPHRKQYRR